MYPRFVHARAKGSIIEIDAFKSPSKNESENIPHFDQLNNTIISNLELINDYYISANFSFKNISNEMWWNVYDNNSNPDYQPPCK